MSTPIRAINIAGGKSAAFYAVNPSGNLIAIPSALTDEQVKAGARPDLKAGFRFATAADLETCRKAESDRAADESAKAAKAAKAGGPLA